MGPGGVGLVTVRFLLAIYLVMGTALTAQTPEGEPEPEDLGIAQLGTDRIRFGGWVDLLMRGAENRDTYFDMPHLYLHADISFTDRWSSFVEGRYKNPPDIDGEPVGGQSTFERAYVQYRHSGALGVRLGKFNTPSGLWKQLPWLILADSNRKPLIDDLGYLPAQSEGVEVFGNVMGPSALWNYSVFLTDREGEADTPGYGADLSWFGWNRIKLGGFFYDFESRAQGFDPLEGERRGHLYYGEWHIIRDRLLLRSEFLELKRENAVDLDGRYVKLRWYLDRNIYLNARVEDVEEPTSTGSGRHEVDTLTLGFRPSAGWHMRFEWAQHRPKDMEMKRFGEWSVWLGYQF